jgi:hypothetical protein
MITDKKLVELGFRCYQVYNLIYFEKGEVKLERIHNGYLCERIHNGYLCTRPHRVVKTIKELKELL